MSGLGEVPWLVGGLGLPSGCWYLEEDSDGWGTCGSPDCWVWLPPPLEATGNLRSVLSGDSVFVAVYALEGVIESELCWGYLCPRVYISGPSLDLQGL